METSAPPPFSPAVTVKIAIRKTNKGRYLLVLPSDGHYDAFSGNVFSLGAKVDTRPTPKEGTGPHPAQPLFSHSYVHHSNGCPLHFAPSEHLRFLSIFRNDAIQGWNENKNE